MSVGIESNDIALNDGAAVAMGDGVFWVRQDSEDGPQNVVLTKRDLEVLLAAC